MAEDIDLSGNEAKSLYVQWRDEIEAYDKDAEQWTERAEKVIKRYKDERKLRYDKSRQMYNILWANVQVLIPALYAHDPVPRVERRFKQKDPVSRVVAEMLQKCLSYHIECDSFGNKMRSCVLDRLLPGRGTSWVRYEPTFSEQEVQITDDQGEPRQDEEGNPVVEMQQDVTYEKASVDFVHWHDFGHTWGRTWEEVRGVWRRSHMTRKQLEARFGEIGRAVPIEERETKDGKREVMSQRKAKVYEVWDKETGNVIWLALGMDKVLDARPDPLGLEGFFPCPKPLFATLANDTIIPTPDYVFYEDQARELEMVTERIALIMSGIRWAGLYDASAKNISRLFTERAENVLIPVDEWAAFAERGGLKGAIDFIPLDQANAILQTLYASREQTKRDIQEITGLSDIVRGQGSVQKTTATEQQIKSQYATLRLSESQTEVARFARDNLRIMADLIASKFSRNTLSLMSGIRLMTQEEKQAIQMQMQQVQQMGGQPPQLPPEIQEALNKPTWEEVENVLRNDKLRAFRIEIETDSTISTDEQADKQAISEMLQAIGAFSQGVGVAVQAQTLTPEAGREIVNAALRKFRFAEQVEEAMESTNSASAQMQQMQQMAAQLQQAQEQFEQEKQQAAQQLKEQERMAKSGLDAERTKMEAEAIKKDAEVKAATSKLQSMLDSFMNQIQAPAQAAKEKGDAQSLAAMQQMAVVANQTAQQAIAAINQPKTVDIIRDPITGRPQQLQVTPTVQ